MFKLVSGTRALLIQERGQKDADIEDPPPALISYLACRYPGQTPEVGPLQKPLRMASLTDWGEAVSTGGASIVH